MRLKRALGLGMSLLIIPASAGCLTSCADKYDIWIWGPNYHREVYMNAVEEYRKLHPEFKYTVGFADKGDAGVDANVQKDVETAGSILVLPNDELITLRRMGALSPLLDTDGHNDITWAKENHVPASVEATKVGEKYLAYPISADNGFVFVYNKEAFVGTSVWDSNNDCLKEGYTFRDLYKALDQKGDDTETGYKWKTGGKVIWPIGSAWYESGVFFATGCDYSVEYDERGEQKSVECTFGDEVMGMETARCMINTATEEDGKWSDHFVFTDDSDPAYNDYVTAHTGTGEHAFDQPLAGIVTWNNGDLRKAWDADHYRAQILPKLIAHSDGTSEKWIGDTTDSTTNSGYKEYTWRSFSGFKLIAVNPFSRFARQGNNVEILHDLTKYLAGEETSVARYEATQLGPSNIHASEHEEIKNDKFLSALNKQFSLEDDQGHVIGCRTQDNTPKNFWTPVSRVGKAIWESSGKTSGIFKDQQRAKDFLKQVENDIKSTGE